LFRITFNFKADKMQIAPVDALIRETWLSLKIWRKMRFGPLSMLFKFERSVPVTRNSRRRQSLGRRNADASSVMHGSAGAAPSHPNRPGVAVVVGVGPGFGQALALALATDGYEVILVSRNAARLDTLVAEIRETGGRSAAYGCDATMEHSVQTVFKLILANHGVPELVVYSLQSFGPGKVLDIDLPAFEDGLKHNCVGPFLVAREAGRAMLPLHRGSIILVGSTSAMIGREGHLNLAAGKFGQRALSQVLARELWPEGIHVAHVVIDADISEDDTLDDGEAHANPAHIAQSVLHLHQQPKSAWTSELDLRPWNEKFWEHC
jgi:NAD(P)-dependent dehydrogenase (short-subunit alcohol dehydrogenase family)